MSARTWGECLLGVDIGTSGCKLALFTLDGETVARAAEGYAVSRPRPGFAEQDADGWWAAVCRGVRSLLAESGTAPADIAGVGVAGQGWAALPVDRAGRALRPAIIWLDRRAERQCQTLRERIGEAALFAVSGNPLSPGYTTAKILWLQAEEPDVLRRTGAFLQSNSFIVRRLTGVNAQDVSQGYGIHAFDIERREWNRELCRELGLDPAWLPDLCECDRIVGGVTEEAARATGLLAGTPVAAGGLDAACAALGVGAVHPGEAQEQGGQAGGMSIALDRPVRHERLILGCHAAAGMWLLQGGTTGGGSLRWFARQFAALQGASAASEEAALLAALDAEAQRAPPGANGLVFLPYMAGERSPVWDSRARGVWLGLTYETDRGRMARAIMEGCAFALRHNLQTAAEAGADARVLCSMGGAANSGVWMQIKADVTGRRLRAAATGDATALGAALLAGIGTGAYRSAPDAVLRAVRFRGGCEPVSGVRSTYDRLYAAYLETYRRLRDVFPLLEDSPPDIRKASECE